MTGSQSRMTLYTLAVYWSCILLGLGIPWLATILVDMRKHEQPFLEAVRQVRLHLFAPGYNLFLIALLNAVPFVIFAVFSLFHLGLTPEHERKLCGRRGAAVLFTMSVLIAVSVWTHTMTLWHADAQGALAYMFLPLLLLVLMPIGYAIGRALGSFMFR
jgi:hypothetical protein